VFGLTLDVDSMLVELDYLTHSARSKVTAAACKTRQECLVRCATIAGLEL
jgi:hypothetical protein